MMSKEEYDNIVYEFEYLYIRGFEKDDLSGEEITKMFQLKAIIDKRENKK